jgi:hypothetical protein
VRQRFPRLVLPVKLVVVSERSRPGHLPFRHFPQQENNEHSDKQQQPRKGLRSAEKRGQRVWVPEKNPRNENRECNSDDRDPQPGDPPPVSSV